MSRCVFIIQLHKLLTEVTIPLLFHLHPLFFHLHFVWFGFWFGLVLFQKIREPVPSSNNTLEIAHCALEGSVHLPKLPCGFRIYVTISKHQIMVVCQEQTVLLYLLFITPAKYPDF